MMLGIRRCSCGKFAGKGSVFCQACRRGERSKRNFCFLGIQSVVQESPKKRNTCSDYSPTDLLECPAFVTPECLMGTPSTASETLGSSSISQLAECDDWSAPLDFVEMETGSLDGSTGFEEPDESAVVEEISESETEDDGLEEGEDSEESEAYPGCLESPILVAVIPVLPMLEVDMDSADQPIDDHCFNCHRSVASNCDGIKEYRVTLALHPVSDITFKIKFYRSFERESCERLDGSVTLCSECRSLVSITGRAALGNKVTWSIAWPVYMWAFLSDLSLLSEHGCQLLEYVPQQWQQFWLVQLHKHRPLYFPSADRNHYEQSVRKIVVDITERKREMDGMRTRLKLGEMKTVCDKHLMPLVLCPWGCSSYFHSTGSCSYDALLAKFFPEFHLAGRFSTSSQQARVQGSRSDYFTASADCHLFNPVWMVHASIYYDESCGPLVKTCTDHKLGDGLQYFHLPKSYSTLPARQADSLAAAVLRTRTLKPSKPKAFSDECRLQEMQASYCGIDTAFVSQTRHFDYGSHLEDLSEARAFAHRDDIKGLSARFCENKVLSWDYLENLKQRSRAMFPEFDRKGSAGASYASLTDCISLQKCIRSSNVIEVDDTSGRHRRTLVFKPNWQLSMFRVHPYDGYGSKMPLAAKFKVAPKWKKENPKASTNLSAFWFLANMAVCTAELWAMLHANVRVSTDWRGYFLSYIARKVLKNSSRGGVRQNPFFVGVKHKLLTEVGLSDYIFGSCNIATPSWRNLGNPLTEETRRADFISLRMNTDLNCRNCFRRNRRHLTGQTIVLVSRNVRDKPMECIEGTVDAGEGFKCELRFIGVYKQEKGDEWSGEAWSRHGGDLNSWWCRETNRKLLLRRPDPPRVDLERVAFLLYVRVEEVEIDNLRRDYLKFIGGQSDFFCKKHGIPLVTSLVTRKSDKAKQCCLFISGKGAKDRCGLFEDLECPVSDCSCCICKVCRIDKGGTCDITYVSGIPLSDSAPLLGEVLRQEVPQNESLPLEQEDSSGFDEASEDAVGDMGDIDFSVLHSGFDQPMFDIEHCREDGERAYLAEDEAQFDGLIPTSHEDKAEPIYDADLGCMGTSVLLNKFGTVLVRRDNRLQASRRERNLVERVVSVKDIGSVPLVHMEGMLFPSIFWSQPKSADGGLLGAIPTALFCQHSTRARYNIASLASHARLRLKSIGNTASTSPNYLSFLFDSLANGALEGQDTRVVLSRGFEDAMGAAGMRMKNKEDDLCTDTIDNRQMCHNLCASQKYLPATLFVTFTCNQSEHFGIRNIKRYIDSPEAVKNYRRCLSDRFPIDIELTLDEEREVAMSMHEAAKGLMVRNWMEVRRLLIDYIVRSDEQPLSAVAAFFARDEYQGEAGNLSHVHMMITLVDDYNSAEGRRKIQSLIRGFISEIVGIDEVEAFINEGILEDWEDYWRMKNQASRILPHSCSSHRCLRRVGVGTDEVKCRVPDTRKLSGDITTFFERKIDIEHSSDALRILERLEFCEPMDKNGGKFIPKSDFLDSKRILAPARLGEGNITPVVGRLFAATRSSMNVQVCTSFGTCRYLVKCITKIDANSYLVFSAKKGQPESFKVEKVNLHNTKITSSAKNEKKKLKGSRHGNRPRGRPMAQTEMMQIILGYPQVISNIECVKVSTLPLGDRTGYERKSPAERFEEEQEQRRTKGQGRIQDMFSHVIPHIQLRKELKDTARWHTVSQETLLEDQLWSKVTLDKVTIFGARPPELLCIDRMEWYFRFFRRSDTSQGIDHTNFGDYIHEDLDRSSWVDGLGFIVKLLSRAIDELRDIISSEPFLGGIADRNQHNVLVLFQKICEFHGTVGIKGSTSASGPGGPTLRTRTDCIVWERCQDPCIDADNLKSPLPVPVMSNVQPKNATKFIIHLLLTMGHFDTEADMWTSSSMASAFIKARIVKSCSADAITEADCDEVLRRWIQDQARFYPITSRIMDKLICSAQSIIRAVLLRDETPIDEVPPYLCARLCEARTEAEKAYLIEVRSNVVGATLTAMESTHSNHPSVLPTRQQLMDATPSNPVSWEPSMPISVGQSLESFEEQRRVQQATEQQILKYASATTTAVKNFVIVGPPGAGKTHCLQHSVIYACARGLVCITTAMLAERAYLLGGQHFHRLFKLQVRDKGRPHRLAELAVIALQKQPELLVLLRALDVLFVDEMGQLSAEMLSVIDIILRRVRNSSLFMGGILVIGTLDQVQLRPIKELPFLLSPYVLTTFSMGRLQHYVRCASCEVLKEMNGIARFFTGDLALREHKLQRFASLVSGNCTFVDDWSDPLVTEQVLRIFPKRRQAAEATDAFLKNKRKLVRGMKQKYLTCASRDTMVAMESHGEWCDASSAVVAHLNRSSSEPPRLDFFLGAVYHFTCNKPRNFNATQLAVLAEMPTRKDLKEFGPIKVMAAPPGTKTADIDGSTKQQLVDAGWREVVIGPAPECATTMWQQGVKAKRLQYGLKHHVASTVHCAIGHTMVKIATQLSIKIGLWERAMVVVLISRVRKAQDIIFVGDKSENISALTQGLRIRCQCDECMNHVVDVLSGITEALPRIPLRLSEHPHRPRDIVLPSDSSGVVYLLVSAKSSRSFYVGMTQNLPLRLNQHNSGYGAKQSCSEKLRPWALCAYAAGFEGDRNLMLQFERAWQVKNLTHRPSTAAIAAGFGQDLIEEYFRDSQLVLVVSL